MLPVQEAYVLNLGNPVDDANHKSNPDNHAVLVNLTLVRVRLSDSCHSLGCSMNSTINLEHLEQV